MRGQIERGPYFAVLGRVGTHRQLPGERNAVPLVGLDPRAAVEALTHTPARALGLDHRFGRLHTGYAADAVLLDHEWTVRRVWADGRALEWSVRWLP